MLQNLLFASLSHLRNLKLKRVINSIFKSKDIISNLVKLEYFDIVELKLLNFNFFNYSFRLNYKSYNYNLTKPLKNSSLVVAFGSFSPTLSVTAASLRLVEPSARLRSRRRQRRVRRCERVRQDEVDPSTPSGLRSLWLPP